MKKSRRYRSLLFGLACLLLIALPVLNFGVDTDFDGIVNALDPDNDNDGLSDWDEINRYWSNPDVRDTDGDLIDDGREVNTGTSPIDIDSDGDHLSDTLEYTSWNPQAYPVSARYYRCPYIADLPHLSTNLEDNRLINHVFFAKGNETTNETVIYQPYKQTYTHKRTIGLYKSHWDSLHLYSHIKGGFRWDPLQLDLSTDGGVTLVFGPYLDIGGGYEHARKSIWGSEEQDIVFDYDKFSKQQGLYNNYTQQNWILSSATFIANISLTNTFDRTTRVDKIVFDLVFINSSSNEEIVVHSSTLSPLSLPPLTLGLGEKISFTASFTVSEQEWVTWVTSGIGQLSIQINTLEQSVWSDIAGWISQDVTQEDITADCVQVQIYKNETETESLLINKWVTANVDKIDGLNVLQSFDRLFLNYDYRFGRIIEIEGTPSVPGEKVWSYRYLHAWHDPNSLENETSFTELRMWGRGLLSVTLQKDSDGDWLVDWVEAIRRTDPQDPDTDNDFADDYVETVLARSNPLDPDTDDGGTVDGVEYFEGLDPLDSSDDLLVLPDWYVNHPTMNYAKKAAELLLSEGIYPTADQLYWPYPDTVDKSLSTYDYIGPVASVINQTLFSVGEAILCIDVGNLDGDLENEIIVGTAPSGYVYIFDNSTGPWTPWSPAPFVNMTHYYVQSLGYAVNPVKVWDVAIGDATNTNQNNTIVLGTWYYDNGDQGGVYYFQPPSNLTAQIDEIEGGVYSVAIGDAKADGENYVIIGQGGSDTLGNGSINCYEYNDFGFFDPPELVVSTNSSKVEVLIADYLDHQRILFCSYALNSTLGHATFRTIPSEHWNTTIIDTRIVYPGDPPPFEKFMSVGLGDLNLNPSDGKELIVAIDSTTIDDDSIKMYDVGFITLVDSIHFACPEIIVADVDNDGHDEVVFHNSDTGNYPNSNISVCKASSPTSWTVIFIENATEPEISSMYAGDVDVNGEIELLYGTATQGIMRYWNHPPGALWSGISFEWRARIENLGPWFMEGEFYPLNVTVHNVGTPNMEAVIIALNLPSSIISVGPSWQYNSSITPGTNYTFQFLLLPLTSGNLTVNVDVFSYKPTVFSRFPLNILAKPKFPICAQIGQSLLALALATENSTLLEGAVKVGNWLHTKGVTVGDFKGWNPDASFTDYLLPGYLLATSRTGQFFLDLYRVTGDWAFLVDALHAARFLGDPSTGNFTIVGDGGIAWGLHQNGIAEAAEIGIFLNDLNTELLFDFFEPTLTGIVTYLKDECSNNTGQEMTNWYESPGLTVDASKFFVELGDTASLNIAKWAGNWVTSLESNTTWLSTLNMSIRADNVYRYHNEIGLAGLTAALSFFNEDVNVSCVNEIVMNSDQLVSSAYVLFEGTNWRESNWTTNIAKLLASLDWDLGAAGVGASLASSYKTTGNQTYLDYALNASNWIAYCIDFIEATSVPMNISSGALADSINSLLYIHSVLPVIFVGYFVDPMTSLSETSFNVTGYVQTLGWHAYNVNLTIIHSPAFLLGGGQTKSIAVGDLPSPSTSIVNWNLTLLVYGEFEITVYGNSTNAGTSQVNATVVVTDLGVSKAGWESVKAVRLYQTTSIEDRLYNVGEPVLIPIRVAYMDNTPAVNASVKFGDYGTGLVNASGYTEIIITSYEPGTIEIPVTIRYDKRTGISTSLNTTTVSLTFTSLEVYGVSSSSAVGSTGFPITFSGRVRYSHNQSNVPFAIVSFNGLFNVSTDAFGNFAFSYTEQIPITENYTITALSDASNRISVCTQEQVIQIQWLPFWTPITIGAVAGLIIIVIVVAVFVFLRIRRRRTPKPHTEEEPAINVREDYGKKTVKET
jgi:hypothetical protein